MVFVPFGSAALKVVEVAAALKVVEVAAALKIWFWYVG